ncbi:VanZ family protein [Methylocystis echinoides]|nr:VanZ family protein [Methylocystis echinoides]
MRRLGHLYSRRRGCLQLAVWACVMAIVILSLVPGAARPQTGAPGELEHFVAYLGTGLFISARYRSLLGRLSFWAAVVALSFSLEFLQQFVPGREPDLLDAWASSSGVTLGVFCAALAIGAIHRRGSVFSAEVAVDPAE